MKRFFACCLATAALGIDLKGASYSTTFNSFPGPEVKGTDGWTMDDSTTGLSFLPLWNGSKAAALGGLIDAPIAATTRLTHGYGASLGSTTMALDFTIVDSNNAYPNRDIFGISLLSGTDNLLTIFFTPAAQTASPNQLPEAQWNLSYQAGTAPMVSLTQGVIEGGGYGFNLGLTPNGPNTDFVLKVMGGNTVTRSGTIAIHPNSQVSDFGLLWTASQGVGASGDNFFVVDNLSVVPEPFSTTVTSLLLLGFAGWGAHYRRRRLQSHPNQPAI